MAIMAPISSAILFCGDYMYIFTLATSPEAPYLLLFSLKTVVSITDYITDIYSQSVVVM